MTENIKAKKESWARAESFLFGVASSVVASVLFLLIFGDSSEYYKLKIIGIYGTLVLGLLMVAYLVVVRIKEVLSEIKFDATESSNKQKLIFDDLIGKSRSYVDYFYKQACSLMLKGKLPDDQNRIWDTEELTNFEINVPPCTLVVIDRPVAISASLIPSLTEVIKTNAERGVEYKIIGTLPPDLEGVNNVSKLDVAGLEKLANASLVLPHFGMVLYIVPNINDLPADELVHWNTVHIPSHNHTPVSKEVRIRGFVTIPYGLIGSEHAYFAVPLSSVDIDQLARRIWNE